MIYILQFLPMSYHIYRFSIYISGLFCMWNGGGSNHRNSSWNDMCISNKTAEVYGYREWRNGSVRSLCTYTCLRTYVICVFYMWYVYVYCIFLRCCFQKRYVESVINQCGYMICVCVCECMWIYVDIFVSTICYCLSINNLQYSLSLVLILILPLSLSLPLLLPHSNFFTLLHTQAGGMWGLISVGLLASEAGYDHTYAGRYWYLKSYWIRIYYACFFFYMLSIVSYLAYFYADNLECLYLSFSILFMLFLFFTWFF